MGFEISFVRNRRILSAKAINAARRQIVEVKLCKHFPISAQSLGPSASLWESSIHSRSWAVPSD